MVFVQTSNFFQIDFSSQHWLISRLNSSEPLVTFRDLQICFWFCWIASLYVRLRMLSTIRRFDETGLQFLRLGWVPGLIRVWFESSSKLEAPQGHPSGFPKPRLISMCLFWFEIRHVFPPSAPGCCAEVHQSFGSSWFAMLFITSFVLDIGRMNEAGVRVFRSMVNFSLFYVGSGSLEAWWGFTMSWGANPVAARTF